MQAHSVLDGVTRDQVRLAPYPHLVIEDCLPAEYYAALAAAYPSNETILDFCRVHPYRRFGFADGAPKQNYRYDIPAFQALGQPQAIPPIWREFVDIHTSGRFLGQVLEILGPEIQATYPQLERRLGKPLERFAPGIRYRTEGDLYLDCQIGINTPATRESSTRGVHADAAEELFAILLYVKDPADDTAGGDLEIYRWRRPGRRRFVGSEADPSAAELVDTVAYRANTMIMFLNSPDALHAVTPRAPSAHTRRLTNIIGEVGPAFPHGLFSRPKRWDLDYLRRKTTSLASKLRRA